MLITMQFGTEASSNVEVAQPTWLCLPEIGSISGASQRQLNHRVALITLCPIIWQSPSVAISREVSIFPYRLQYPARVYVLS